MSFLKNRSIRCRLWINKFLFSKPCVMREKREREKAIYFRPPEPTTSLTCCSSNRQMKGKDWLLLKHMHTQTSAVATLHRMHVLTSSSALLTLVWSSSISVALKWPRSQSRNRSLWLLWYRSFQSSFRSADHMMMKSKKLGFWKKQVKGVKYKVRPENYSQRVFVSREVEKKVLLHRGLLPSTK